MYLVIKFKFWKYNFQMYAFPDFYFYPHIALIFLNYFLNGSLKCIRKRDIEGKVSWVLSCWDKTLIVSAKYFLRQQIEKKLIGFEDFHFKYHIICPR